MQSRIQKWGNSLALRIPKAFALEAEMDKDTLVEMRVENGQLIIRPVPEREWSLDDLLEDVTPENLHQEVDTGDSVGSEAW